MFGVFIVLSVFVGSIFSQSSSVMTSSTTSSMQVQTWEDLSVMQIRLITELSRLCIVLSRRDYRLDTSRPYTYLQYPSSYKATLIQAVDLVERVLRETEMNMGRAQMVAARVPQEIDTAVTILSEGTSIDLQSMLPITLRSINRIGTDITSIVKTVLTGLESLKNFFNELLQSVQPTPSSSTTSRPDVSTTTLPNQSPLDIDHATVLSKILTYINTMITRWNQVAEISTKLAPLADRALKLMNDRNTLIWTLSDIDETADLLLTLVATYAKTSRKMITPRIFPMNKYLMINAEQERFTEVQKMIEQSNKDISEVQQSMAQFIAEHQTITNERNKQYQQLASRPSF